jgi:hypothetical protein
VAPTGEEEWASECQRDDQTNDDQGKEFGPRPPYDPYGEREESGYEHGWDAYQQEYPKEILGRVDRKLDQLEPAPSSWEPSRPLR